MVGVETPRHWHSPVNISAPFHRHCIMVGPAKPVPVDLAAPVRARAFLILFPSEKKSGRRTMTLLVWIRFH